VYDLDASWQWASTKVEPSITPPCISCFGPIDLIGPKESPRFLRIEASKPGDSFILFLQSGLLKAMQCTIQHPGFELGSRILSREEGP